MMLKIKNRTNEIFTGKDPKDVVFPKDYGDLRGIVLVKVLDKMAIGIMKLWLLSSIAFQKNFHGFRSGWGTGTVSLESNLLQKPM